MPRTRVEPATYMGTDCRRITDGRLELIATAGFGPRLIRFGFAGGDNILGECPDAVVQTSLGPWRPRGGHRLWAAPESMPRSYAPDDLPVECVAERDGLLLRQTVDGAGIEKELRVALGPEGVRVVHRLTNRGPEAFDAAAWALTIMSGGGTALIPQEPYRSWDDCFLPARPLILWHYTNLQDPRWRLGPRFIRLKSDPALASPQKIGAGNKQGWAAYAKGSTVFVKRFARLTSAAYPHHGSNNEAYTAGSFLELETLGPVRRLEPGEALEHEERWGLFEGFVLDEDDDALQARLAPLVDRVPAVIERTAP
jgi:hypothetical protein